MTRIHSVAGIAPGPASSTARPFRSPHHTISASGLVGGGATPTPGEVSLAHHGVLFLDELSEFNRAALEALRQPLEDGRVVVVRGQRTAIFPTRFMLVAATNPCLCGYLGEHRCRCSEADLARHRRRLSGPLLDRVDLLLYVRRPSAASSPGRATWSPRPTPATRSSPPARVNRARSDERAPHERAAAAPRAARRRGPADVERRLRGRDESRRAATIASCASREPRRPRGPGPVAAPHVASRSAAAGTRATPSPMRREGRGRRDRAPCDQCLRRAGSCSVSVGGTRSHTTMRAVARGARPARRGSPPALGAATPLGSAGSSRRSTTARRGTAARARLAVVCRHDESNPRGCAGGRGARRPARRGGPRPARADRRRGGADRGDRGTRRASRDGLGVARALGRDLALGGVPVVSGMALGVDAAAQSGAVDAGGLHVAVLAGGAEAAYPRRGVRCTGDLAPGLSSARRRRRPRLQAAVPRPQPHHRRAGRSDDGHRGRAPSGSLVTVDLAFRLGRDVAPSPTPSLAGRGRHATRCSRTGATLVRGAQDVLDALSGAGARPPHRRGR